VNLPEAIGSVTSQLGCHVMLPHAAKLKKNDAEAKGVSSSRSATPCWLRLTNVRALRA